MQRNFNKKGALKEQVKFKDNSPEWWKRDWFVFAISFLGSLIFLLICSGYQFLDGDDALQAIWALAKQKHLDPFLFPLHGFTSRSGTFFLIYLFSFLFPCPKISYAILSALGASLSLASLVLYLNSLLGTKAKLTHFLALVCVAPEIIYAGLYPNAAVMGYSLGFLAVFLSIRLIRKGALDWHFIFSGALFGLASSVAMSSAYLALAFPLQHLFLKGDRSWSQVIRRFWYEILAGGSVYCLFLGAMGLSPVSPFQEFSAVVNEFRGTGIRLTLITLLGAFNPWFVLILPAGLILLFIRRAYLALAVGIATSVLYLATLGDCLKSFQHALCIYILFCVCAFLILESLPGRLTRMIYLGLLILPLFFGLRLYLPEQPHRGPGFSEIDPGKALSWDEKDALGLGGFWLWQSPKINLAGHGIRLALGSGFMLPSVDGGRAFGGYFWAWAMDWKPYLDSINKAVPIILSSPEQNVVMGQYPVAGIGMYEALAQGYQLISERPHHEYLFQKGGRKQNYIFYFNQFSGQVGKKELDLGKYQDTINQAMMVVFPSFAYRMEQGILGIKGYSLKPLGYCCFRIERKPE